MITNGQIILPIGIYTICFSREKMKGTLHQSALGLFIRVWEEVRAIFIDYLRNSPSSQFLNMLELFASTQYRYYIRNISHIHLLGKLRQLYEQS